MPFERTEKRPAAPDGTQLYLQRWAPVDKEPLAEVLILHGYMDHGSRFREVAHALAGHAIASTAIDYRGHGHAAGQRGFIHSWDEYIDDMEVGLDALPAGRPHLVLGHSNGGLLALDYISRRKPALAGVIVTNPFLAVALEVAPAKEWLGNMAARFLPRLALPSGMPSSTLTRDQALVEQHDRDPLVFSTATAGWFGAVQPAQARVRALRRFPTPLLYIYSDADPVAAPAASRALADQLEGDKTVQERPGELHEVLNEIDRAALHEEIAQWCVARAKAS